MTPTVGDIMREVRNYFQYESQEKTWTIEHGRLLDSDLGPGTWIAVTGSLHNDGVYQVEEDQRLPDAADELFEGVVYTLAPPLGFLALCCNIEAWCIAQPHDGVKREAFGGYSRELACDENGMPVTWQQRFARELTPYRRMYTGVKLGC